MILALWLISLSLAKDCDENFLPSTDEFAIAQTIGKLGGVDGRIFSAVIRGYTYSAVAKHFKITPEAVIAITTRGTDIMWDFQHPKEEGQ